MDKTLLKGLSVLEALAEMAGQGPTIDEVAASTGLTRSNAHRTLQTLVHAGYAERENRGGYRCTLKMFSMGLKQFNQLDVRRIAPSYMRSLAFDTGETVHLSVLDGLEVIYLDKIDSVHPIGAYSTIGGRAPAHTVATGKALLSVASQALLDSLPGTLPRFTSATVTDRTVLREELSRAARLGYAINRGEWRDGVGGVAAPVFNALETPVAALGISGPIDRLTTSRMNEFAPRVVEVAAGLSSALGYSRRHFGASV